MTEDIIKSEHKFLSALIAMEVAAAELVHRCRIEVKNSIFESDKCVIKKLYWANQDNYRVPLVIIENEFKLSHRQILELIGTYDCDFPCRVCFGPITLTAKNRDQLDYFDSLCMTCPDCWKEECFASKSDIHEKQEPHRDPVRLAELRSMPYAEYLRTPEWQLKREHVFEYRGKYCGVCRSPDNLNVHHNTYERRGDEYVTDLFVLCADCHQIFHENGKLARPE
jgi:hypothetical protein